MRRFSNLVSIGGGVAILVVIAGGLASSAALEIKGKALQEVYAVVVNAATELNLSDDEWTDLPTATTTIRVPAATKALIGARWTGVSNPTSSLNSGLQMRIMVGADQAQPADDGVYYATHIALERSLGPVPGGTYEVKVQLRLAPCGGCTQDTNFSSSHLTVERIKM